MLNREEVRGMAQEQQKSEQYKCHECGMSFNSEHEHRQHQEKAHGGKAKGAVQGQSHHSGQGKQ